MKLFAPLAIPISLAGLGVAQGACSSDYQVVVTKISNKDAGYLTASPTAMLCSLSPMCLVSALMRIPVSLDSVWDANCGIYSGDDWLIVDPLGPAHLNACNSGMLLCDTHQAING